FTDDGKRLVSTGIDETIRLWEVATGRELQVIKGYESGYDVQREAVVRVSRDAKLIASWPNNDNDDIHLWDLTKGQLQHRLPLTTSSGSIIGLAFSADGKTLASTAEFEGVGGGGFAGAGPGGGFGGNFGGGALGGGAGGGFAGGGAGFR